MEDSKNKMTKRDDTLIVEFNKEDTSTLNEWKRLCLYTLGIGGIKKRVSELIKEDLKKLKKEKQL